MITLLVAAAAVSTARAAAVVPANPIAIENARRGTSGWRIPGAEGNAIQAYASEVSAAPGELVHLHVSAPEGTRYRIVAFRLGWYGGVGARQVACAPSCRQSLVGTQQATPAPDPTTGEVAANWPVTSSFSVTRAWTTGYYLLDVVATQGPLAGTGDSVPLVVRPAARAAPAPVVVVAAVNTWQAYNSWGGKSAYGYNSSGGPAVKVSFDRPYSGRDPREFEWEYPLVRWAERNGFNMDYTTDVDLDDGTTNPSNYRAVVVSGHSEYWTKAIRDRYDEAEAAGRNFVFTGANVGYSQVRYEDGGRTIVIYRSAASDPSPDPATKGTNFRYLTTARPECALMGVEYQGGLRQSGDPPRDYVVTPAASDDPWFAGTGLASGDTIGSVVGNEWDAVAPGCTPAGSVRVLFHYEARPGDTGSGQRGADAVRYTAMSGSTVFSSGTLSFPWKLDDYGHPGSADARVGRFMFNVMSSLSA